ncbi:hypothetical protein VO56_02165 [Mycoplasmopsis gallinacea]|uniref:Uncharacterized protein n=1 Tax=Mycoplasmopsis gallinacea TaxID=29556 RepID=A0A0D5ZK35_9BACT|nr:hypothetical protein VO56_02165 [Mycoplasmopsis gallinacea]
MLLNELETFTKHFLNTYLKTKKFKQTYNKIIKLNNLSYWNDKIKSISFWKAGINFIIQVKKYIGIIEFEELTFDELLSNAVFQIIYLSINKKKKELFKQSKLKKEFYKTIDTQEEIENEKELLELAEFCLYERFLYAMKEMIFEEYLKELEKQRENKKE